MTTSAKRLGTGCCKHAPVRKDVIQRPDEAAVQGALGHLQAGVHVSSGMGGFEDPQVVLHGADEVWQVQRRGCSSHMSGVSGVTQLCYLCSMAFRGPMHQHMVQGAQSPMGASNIAEV